MQNKNRALFVSAIMLAVASTGGVAAKDQDEHDFYTVTYLKGDSVLASGPLAADDSGSSAYRSLRTIGYARCLPGGGLKSENVVVGYSAIASRQPDGQLQFELKASELANEAAIDNNICLSTPPPITQTNWEPIKLQLKRGDSHRFSESKDYSAIIRRLDK